ncbi:hypothetical protein N7465_010051 [Penicillium sp. CMV-2018d]|nr:hypothetical protein N7465_010051 [Penicillium sp. CMV-2018d]
MTSYKRPVTLSPEETYLDDPSDEEDCKTQSNESRLKESALKKLLSLLKSDCVPRKLNGEPNIRSAFRFNVKDLSGRYHEGGVTQLTSASWQISRFHNTIEDWFRYSSRTVEVNLYD